jgi:hypothetical protein
MTELLVAQPVVKKVDAGLASLVSMFEKLKGKSEQRKSAKSINLPEPKKVSDYTRQDIITRINQIERNRDVFLHLMQNPQMKRHYDHLRFAIRRTDINLKNYQSSISYVMGYFEKEFS